MEELCVNLEMEYVDIDLQEQNKRTSNGLEGKRIGTDENRAEPVKEPARIYKPVHRCKVYTGHENRRDDRVREDHPAGHSAAAVSAGTGMGTAGSGFETGNDGQLGDPDFGPVSETVQRRVPKELNEVTVLY